MDFTLFKQTDSKELFKEVTFVDINQLIDEFALRVVSMQKYNNPWLTQFRDMIFTKKNRVSKEFINQINSDFNVEYLLNFYKFIFFDQYKAIEIFQNFIDSGNYKKNDVYPLIKDNYQILKTKFGTGDKKDVIKNTNQILLQAEKLYDQVLYERELLKPGGNDGLMYRQRIIALTPVAAKISANGFYMKIEPNFDFLKLRG